VVDYFEFPVGWNEKIALFDMDGTLTAPRKHMLATSSKTQEMTKSFTTFKIA